MRTALPGLPADKIIAGADGSFKDHGTHQIGAACAAYIEPAHLARDEVVYILNATYTGHQSASNSEIAAATLLAKALANRGQGCTVHASWDCDETLGHLLHARPALKPADNETDGEADTPATWEPRRSNKHAHNPHMARLIRVLDNAAADANSPSWYFYRQKSGHHGLDQTPAVIEALNPEWDPDVQTYKLPRQRLQALRSAVHRFLAEESDAPPSLDEIDRTVCNLCADWGAKQVTTAAHNPPAPTHRLSKNVWLPTTYSLIDDEGTLLQSDPTTARRTVIDRTREANFDHELTLSDQAHGEPGRGAAKHAAKLNLRNRDIDSRESTHTLRNQYTKPEAMTKWILRQMAGALMYNEDAAAENPRLRELQYVPAAAHAHATQSDAPTGDAARAAAPRQQAYTLGLQCLFCLKAGDATPGPDTVHHVYHECSHAHARHNAEREICDELARRTKGAMPIHLRELLARTATANAFYYAGQVPAEAVSLAREYAKTYPWPGPAQDERAEELEDLGKQKRRGYRPGSLHNAIVRATHKIHTERAKLIQATDTYAHSYNLPAFQAILRRTERDQRQEAPHREHRQSHTDTLPNPHGAAGSAAGPQPAGGQQHNRQPTGQQPANPAAPQAPRHDPTTHRGPRSSNPSDRPQHEALNSFYTHAGLEDANAPGAGANDCAIFAAMGVTVDHADGHDAVSVAHSRAARQARADMCGYARSLPEDLQATLAGAPAEQNCDDNQAAEQHARVSAISNFIAAHERNGPVHDSMLPCLAAALNKTIILVTVLPSGTPAPRVRVFYPPSDRTHFDHNNPLQETILDWRTQVAPHILNPRGHLHHAQVISNNDNHYRTTIRRAHAAAPFGSIERFFGVLIESTAGDFPFWLAPTQLRLLPVSDDFLPHCEAAVAKLAAAGVRAEVDPGGRSVGKQIKIANQVRATVGFCGSGAGGRALGQPEPHSFRPSPTWLQHRSMPQPRLLHRLPLLTPQDKIPILSVVGSAEVEAGTLKLEMRKGSQLGEFPVAEAVALLAAAANKAVEPIDVQAL